MSFPITLDGTDLCALLPDATAVSVKSGNYWICGDGTRAEIAAGRGYWVYYKVQTPVSFRASMRMAAVKITVRLEKGWNMIGPPSSLSVDWNDEILIDGAALSKSGKIKGAPLGYDSTKMTYFAAKKLEPWEGYAVYAMEPCTLEFPGGGDITYKPAKAGDIISEAGVMAVKQQLVLQLTQGAAQTQLQEAITKAGGSIVGYNPYLGLYQVQFPDGADMAAAENGLKQENGIAAVSPNIVFNASDYVPNDPPYSAASDPGMSWAFQRIGASKVWKSYSSVSEPLIAVVDTGVDGAQHDLAGRLAEGATFLAPDALPVQDPSGHGTHIAGIIAAAGDNAFGIAGVCWNCRIMPVRVCDAQGICPFFAVMNGITYAANNGAAVINLSLEGAALPGSAAWDIFQNVIDYAKASNVFVVAAAGNHSIDVSGIVPAGLNGVFTVGATDENDARAGFSGYGAKVSLAAPGARIYSLESGGGTGYRDGTSMSAAFVAGAAGLLKSAQPALGPAEIGKLLKSKSDELPAGAALLGAGRLNLEKLLGVFLSENRPPAIAIKISKTALNMGETTGVTVMAIDPDGDAVNYEVVAGGGVLTPGGGNRWTWQAPGMRGEYEIRASVSDGKGGVAVATATIKAELDGLYGLHIMPGVNTLNQGDIVRFTIYGDFPEGMIYPVQAVWEMGSPHGVITQEGKFTALSPGDAIVTARVGKEVRNFKFTILKPGEAPPPLTVAGFTNHGVAFAPLGNDYRIVVGDLNSDGNNDVIIGDVGNVARIYLGQGGGNFPAAPSFYTDTACQVSDMSLGDIDNDGDLDLVQACKSNQGFVVLKNNGFGILTTSQRLCNGSCSGSSVHFADMDNNLLLDLVASDLTSNHGVYIYNNDGAGNFPATPNYEVGTKAVADAHSYVVPADFNKDGYMDFAEAIYRVGGGPIRVFSYTSAGVYTQTWQSGGLASVNYMAAGEIINGGAACDGVLDLLLNNGNTLLMFQGTGNGGFTNAGGNLNYPLGFNIYSIAVGETQNNYMPEILIGTDSAVNPAILYTSVNDAQQCAVGYNQLSTIVTGTYEAKFADLDGQKGLDIVDAGPVGGQNDVWLNDAGTRAAPLAPAYASCSVYMSGPDTYMKLEWEPPAPTTTTVPELLTYDFKVGTTVGGTAITGMERWSGAAPAGPGNYGLPYKLPAATRYQKIYKFGPEIPTDHYFFNIRTVDAAYNRSQWYSQAHSGTLNNLDCNSPPAFVSDSWNPPVLLNNNISQSVYMATLTDLNGGDEITATFDASSISGNPLFTLSYTAPNQFSSPAFGAAGVIKTSATPGDVAGILSVRDASNATPLAPFTPTALQIRKWPDGASCQQNWISYKCNENGFSVNDNASLLYPFQLAWTKTLPNVSTITSPLLYNGVVYFGGTDVPSSQGTLYGYWDLPSGVSDFFTPVPVGAGGMKNVVINSALGVIYLVSADNKIYARKTDDGTQYAPPYATGMAGSLNAPPLAQTSPIGAYDMLFLVSGAGEVNAIKKINPANVWTKSLGAGVVFQTAPVINNGIIYIGSAAGSLYAYDTISGTPVWASTPNYGAAITDLATKAGTSQLIVTTNDNRIRWVNTVDGSLIASIAPNANAFGPAAFVPESTGTRSKVYVGDSVGKVWEYYWDGAAVTSRFSQVTPAPGAKAITTAPIYMNNTLYVGTSGGYMYAIATAGSSMTVESNLSVCTGAGGITGGPIMGNEKLFVICGNDSPRKLVAIKQKASSCPIVTSSSDSGVGTLRECIQTANTTPGTDNIRFDITKMSSPTINLSSQLVAITGPNGNGTTINGEGNNITIKGGGCANCDGFTINADNVAISNLTINGFSSAACAHAGGPTGCAGIVIKPSVSATVTGNYIGTTSGNGLGAGIENYYGILAYGDSLNPAAAAVIGTAAAGNYISGNKSFGIVLGSYAENTIVKGNRIGSRVDGTSCLNATAQAMGNKGGGVDIQADTSGNSFGADGTDAAEKNLISCNGVSGTASLNTPGVYIHGTNSNGNLILGNYIGLCADGTTACGNWGPGVRLDGAGTVNTIGGTPGTTVQTAVISANKLDGITIKDTSHTSIYQTRIGLTASDDYISTAGNLGNGISISSAINNGAQFNDVGNTTQTATTTIAFNGKDGIVLDGVNGSQLNVNQNQLYGPRLYSNNNLSVSEEPIRLKNGGGGGITPPTMGAYTSLGSDKYNITVNSCSTCWVYLYRADDTAHGIAQDDYLSGGAYHGEGFEIIGKKRDLGPGIVTFTNVTVSGGQYVTAIQYDVNNTSQFAANLNLITDTCVGANSVVSNTNDSGASSLRQ
ncbi:MAG: S8 family serine peptidase, partial [bacterium]